ncbi:MAG TPA: GAF domain-containing protein [Burkholderiales bacterium]|nr:GAF domain-containing protein [Burkholderiales bacterium]
MDRWLRILLVEDVEADAELQLRELRRTGLNFDAHRVQSESAFLARLSEFVPDIIMSDFSIPGFGGMQALEIARDRASETPFIFVSGTIGEETAVESLRRGATDYVLKTNLARLGPVVRRAIAEARERRARRAAEQRALALTNLYAALSESNDALARAQDRDAVFRDICRIAVARGGFRYAWVGLVDDEGGLVQPAAHFGADGSAVERAEVPLDARQPGGRGTMATAAREGRPSVCNDILADRRFSAVHERMRMQEFRSTAALPLLLEGRSIGGFGLYASEAGYFDDERMHLLGELAGNIAFALGRFEQEARRRRAETEVLEARQQLQALSMRLIEVQEDERREIARELHDEIGQALSLVKIKLQQVVRLGGHDAHSLLEDCIGIADHTLKQVRDISLDLRPPLLDDLGLGAALEWTLQRREQAAGWQTAIAVDSLPGRLASEIETACFRIAQEALTNVARHAQAKMVEVRLHIVGEEIELLVRDDGRGFDPEAVRLRPATRASLGLVSMKERAALVGGRLEISTADGGGTEVRAAIPLRWRT